MPDSMFMSQFRVARLDEKNQFNGDLKVNGKFVSNSDMSITYGIDTANKRMVVYLDGADRGSVYEVTLVYNFNPAGSSFYRAMWHGIISLPTGYDSSNSVHTAVKSVTLAAHVNTGMVYQEPTVCFSNGKTICPVTSSWTNQLAIILTSVTITSSSYPTLISAKVRKIV